jgi:hypothetical protein
MILYVVVPGIRKFESGIQKFVSRIREFASTEIGPMFSVPCHSERSEESAGRRGQQNEIPRCARNDKPSMGIPNYESTRFPNSPITKLHLALHESIFASRRRLTAVSEATGE